MIRRSRRSPNKEESSALVASPAIVVGLVWYGVVWCGVVWCGEMWCGVVWCGEMWCDVMCPEFRTAWMVVTLCQQATIVRERTTAWYIHSVESYEAA